MTSRRPAIKPSSDAETAGKGPFESVWDALEGDPAERQRMKLRSGLMIHLKKQIEAEGWTQKEAARRFGVTQPRVSDLMRGKINLFSIDMLVGMSGAAGLRLGITVKRAA